MRRCAGLLVLLVAVGCGGGGTTTTAPVATVPAAPKPAHPVVVRESEFRLDPAQASGGSAGLVSIRIVNDGKIAHSLAVDGPNGLVELDGSVAPGKEATLDADLDKPGAYTWYCPLDGHRAKGMSGSITVGGSNPARGAEPAGPGTATLTATTTTQTTPTQTETQTKTKTQTRTETKTVTTPAPSPTATTGTPSGGGGY